MPLIIDPSSTCDICLENFTSSRECCCTPCGHVFCRECLNQLPQQSCPICRASLLNRAEPIQPIRKIYVEIADSNGETLRRCKNLEKLLVDKTSNDSLSLRQVERLAISVSELRDANRSSNSDQWLTIIHTLLVKLALSMVQYYDQKLLSVARTSREDEINQSQKVSEEGIRRANQMARSKSNQLKTEKGKNKSVAVGSLHRQSQEKTKKYSEKVFQAEEARTGQKQKLVNRAWPSQTSYPGTQRYGSVKLSRKLKG